MEFVEIRGDDLARLLAVAKAAKAMIDELDNSTGADDWSTSELRLALADFETNTGLAPAHGGAEE